MEGGDQPIHSEEATKEPKEAIQTEKAKHAEEGTEEQKGEKHAEEKEEELKKKLVKFMVEELENAKKQLAKQMEENINKKVTFVFFIRNIHLHIKDHINSIKIKLIKSLKM